MSWKSNHNRERWTRLSILLFFGDSLFGLLVGFLRVPKSVGRVFHRLLGMFVTRLMILFAMMRRGSTVSVSRELVELRGSLMRIVWHTVPLLYGVTKPGPMMSHLEQYCERQPRPKTSARWTSYFASNETQGRSVRQSAAHVLPR